jgi:hypothetical protein
MVSADELAYLHWLGRTQWDGRSHVVELGPWLGATTNALAAGMKSNPARDEAARLHTVDNFAWRPFMAERAAVEVEGGSFRGAFERYTAEHVDLLVVHEARLPDDGLGDTQFDEPVRDPGSGLPLFTGDLVGAPVRILFVDGAKSFKAFHHLLSELPLAPGALLVLQDYQDWASFWIPLMIALLRERGQALELGHVLDSDTVSVRVPGGIDMTGIAADPEQIAVAEGARLLRAAAAWVGEASPAAACKVSLSEVVWLGARGAWTEAHERLEMLAGGWPLRAPIAPLEFTIEWAERKSGRRPGGGSRLAGRRILTRVASAAHRRGAR